MKTIFNKIKNNIILPLVFTAGVAGTTFCQENSDSSLIKFNQENKQVYEDFVNFIKVRGEKRDKEISYLKSIGKWKVLSTSLSPDENPKLIELGFFRFSIGKKFRDNYPWGMEGSDIYGDSYLRNNNGEFNTNDQVEFIKNMPLEKQLSVAKEYTEILKEIMHEETFKNY